MTFPRSLLRSERNRFFSTGILSYGKRKNPYERCQIQRVISSAKLIKSVPKSF